MARVRDLPLAFPLRGERDDTIASLRAAVREYLAADANRVAMIAAWLSADAGDNASNAALASAHARRALVAIDGGATLGS